MDPREASVHPEAIEFVYFPHHPEHNDIWNVAASPDGTVYVGLCNEGVPGLCAQLYAYDTKGRSLRHVFSVDDVTHEDISPDRIPQSKFHTSLGVGRDGRLRAPTHTTAPALSRDFWDIEQAHDDPALSYPGSHYLIYDPKTDSVQDMGIPLPGESTYGGILDVRRNVHYMQTYLRGRLYAIDADSGKARDLGRVNVGGQCILFMDRHGRVFGGDTDGRFWRYDPDRDRTDFLSVRMPRPKERRHLRTALQHGGWGPDGKFYATALYEGRLWRYDPFHGREGRFEDLGMGWGPYVPGRERQGLIWSCVFGPDECLYHASASYSYEGLSDNADSQHYNLRIIRYDPRSGARDNMGVVYHKSSSLLFGDGVLGQDERIYWGDGCSAVQPARLVIFDPAKARAAGRLGRIQVVDGVHTETSINPDADRQRPELRCDGRQRVRARSQGWPLAPASYRSDGDWTSAVRWASCHACRMKLAAASTPARPWLDASSIQIQPSQWDRTRRSNKAGYGVTPVPSSTCRSSPCAAVSDAWTLTTRCMTSSSSASGSRANAAALPVSKLTPRPTSSVCCTISVKISGDWEKSVKRQAPGLAWFS